MLPKTDMYSEYLNYDFEKKVNPSKTYKLDTHNKRVLSGYITNELEAVAQSLYLRLETEKYKYPIYSDLYGSELKKVIGIPEPLVETETIRFITETCMTDDRVDEVSDFKFKGNKENRYCEFKTKTIFGEIYLSTGVVK